MIRDQPEPTNLADERESHAVGDYFMAVPSGRILWDLVDHQGTVVMKNFSTATLETLVRIETRLTPGTFRATEPAIQVARE